MIGLVAGVAMALWSLHVPSEALMASVSSAVRPVPSSARLLPIAARQVGRASTHRIPLVKPQVPAPAEPVTAALPMPSQPVTPTFAWPVDGEVSSCYGERWGRIHVGLDIAARDGQNVMAARDGRVVWSGWMPGYGNMLLVEHERGWYTVYGHNQRHLVEATGDGRALVRAGQPIALVGRTGNATGPHVHFEIRKGIDAVDPLLILPARFQTASR